MSEERARGKGDGKVESGTTVWFTGQHNESVRHVKILPKFESDTAIFARACFCLHSVSGPGTWSLKSLSGLQKVVFSDFLGTLRRARCVHQPRFSGSSLLNCLATSKVRAWQAEKNVMDPLLTQSPKPTVAQGHVNADFSEQDAEFLAWLASAVSGLALCSF